MTVTIKIRDRHLCITAQLRISRTKFRSFLILKNIQIKVFWKSIFESMLVETNSAPSTVEESNEDILVRGKTDFLKKKKKKGQRKLNTLNLLKVEAT